MKKSLVLLLMLVVAGTLSVSAKTDKATKQAIKAEKKYQKQLAKELKNRKDVLKDAEYKQIKTQYFNAEGYGDTYNCKVAQQRFCKVKDLDTGVYVLCDREVSRTQMESAKIFYKLGRCTKLN
ncbi:MAG: hypothetical protein IJW73_07680 [Candidatus Gastranaerophilales bacterium]|nr:hypothetical protein [Candidatus Gastranaerophilales bacterium]